MLVLAVCCGLVLPDCASEGPHLAMVWGVQSKVSSSCVVQGAFFNPLKLRMLDKFLSCLGILETLIGFNNPSNAFVRDSH